MEGISDKLLPEFIHDKPKTMVNNFYISSALSDIDAIASPSEEINLAPISSSEIPFKHEESQIGDCSSIPGDNCLVSSSTGQLDSYFSSPHHSDSSNCSNAHSPELDSTIDSTSEKGIVAFKNENDFSIAQSSNEVKLSDINNTLREDNKNIISVVKPVSRFHQDIHDVHNLDLLPSFNASNLHEELQSEPNFVDSFLPMDSLSPSTIQRFHIDESKFDSCFSSNTSVYVTSDYLESHDLNQISDISKEDLNFDASKNCTLANNLINDSLAHHSVANFSFMHDPNTLSNPSTSKLNNIGLIQLELSEGDNDISDISKPGPSKNYIDSSISSLGQNYINMNDSLLSNLSKNGELRIPVSSIDTRSNDLMCFKDEGYQIKMKNGLPLDKKKQFLEKDNVETNIKGEFADFGSSLGISQYVSSHVMVHSFNSSSVNEEKEEDLKSLPFTAQCSAMKDAIMTSISKNSLAPTEEESAYEEGRSPNKFVLVISEDQELMKTQDCFHDPSATKVMSNFSDNDQFHLKTRTSPKTCSSSSQQSLNDEKYQDTIKKASIFNCSESATSHNNYSSTSSIHHSNRSCNNENTNNDYVPVNQHSLFKQPISSSPSSSYLVDNASYEINLPVTDHTDEGKLKFSNKYTNLASIEQSKKRKVGEGSSTSDIVEYFISNTDSQREDMKESISISVNEKQNDLPFSKISSSKNYLKFWCSDCERFTKDKCPNHAIHTIMDKPVLSRARATLPSLYLAINSLEDEEGEKIGVFTRKFIPKRCQFGPLEGRFVKTLPTNNQNGQPSSSDMIFKINLDGSDGYIDVSEDNFSNWMKFVRRAGCFSEMNCSVVEQEGAIFFLTTTDLPPKKELLAGYSRQYALKYDLPMLSSEAKPNDNQDLLKEGSHDSTEISASSDQLIKSEVKKVGRISTRKKELLRCPVKQNQATSLKCTYCSLRFSNNEVLRIHTFSHGSGNENDQLITRNSQGENLDENSTTTAHDCPQCSTKFSSIELLIEHCEGHSISVGTERSQALRAYKCEYCYKSFGNKERLESHSSSSHRNEQEKPFPCDRCFRRFSSKSALFSHSKFHSNGEKSVKLHSCPICQKNFLTLSSLKRHVISHCVDGKYTCPHCLKKFEFYQKIQRHIRAFHLFSHPCQVCGKIFPSVAKLKLHLLTHSDVKNFECPICGNRFKRKDKMKEHLQRMHRSSNSSNSDRIHSGNDDGNKSNDSNNNKNKRKEANRDDLSISSSNIVKKTKVAAVVKTSDEPMYKCNLCFLSFKRRGMLVNHLCKKHPEISLSSIPELNEPIMLSSHKYFCHHCGKVYKNSTKRKLHILKKHPGVQPPTAIAANRMTVKNALLVYPASCSLCPKQYKTNAKLFQHQRKHHGCIVKKGEANSSSISPATSQSKENLTEQNREISDIQTGEVLPQSSEGSSTITLLASGSGESFTIALQPCNVNSASTGVSVSSMSIQNASAATQPCPTEVGNSLAIGIPPQSLSLDLPASVVDDTNSNTNSCVVARIDPPCHETIWVWQPTS